MAGSKEILRQVSVPAVITIAAICTAQYLVMVSNMEPINRELARIIILP